MIYTKKPVISVVMPVYNGEKFLKRAVDSVLDQTLRNFEFLIIDDGSTDASGRMLQAYARRDRRISLVRNVRNLGLVRSLNRGLQRAKAEIIARFDCDDFCHSQRLVKQYDYMRRHPRCVVTGTQANWVDGEGNILWKPKCPENDREIREAFFCYRTVIQHTTAMYLKIRGLEYREEAYPAEDYDFFLRLFEYGKAHILDEYLVDYYINPGGITSTNRIKQVMAMVAIRKRLIERIRHGKEIHPLPGFKDKNSLRWRMINMLSAAKLKIKNRMAGFLFSCLMFGLSPGFLFHRYFWRRVTKYVDFKEYHQFVDG